MSCKDLSRSARLFTHCVLIIGAVVFSFPFAWMLLTSVKGSREMSLEKLRLLPRAPQPQAITPYIGEDEYVEPKRPDGIPLQVWTALRPRLGAQLGRSLDAWKVMSLGAEDNPPPVFPNREDFKKAMIKGIIKNLSSRISDTARQRAVEVERGRRTALAKDVPVPPDDVLFSSLSPEATEAGVQAILAEVQPLIDDKMLRPIFDDCYRRFCLADVRIRTRDYKSYSLYTGSEWQVIHGPAQLVRRRELFSLGQEVRLHFTPAENSAAFKFVPSLPVPASEVDRVSVSYRADSSWAKIRFEVIRDGQLYQTTDLAHFKDKDWLEQELRWPEGAKDRMERRVYMVLQHAGPAPAGSPPFAVHMSVERQGLAKAWLAKLTANYRGAFKEVPYGRFVMTSVALTLINIVLMIFSSTLVAYSFARLHWPGRDLCFGILLATMMVPGQVTMIPGFLVIRHLGWYNTLIPLWVFSATGSAFFIFLLRQFFKNVPIDLEDAARIDGCGFLRIYWHVMMPLVKPTIATIAIYTFMGVWNDFMGPLIYINDERLFPLALGMFKFSLRAANDVSLMMSGSFVMTLPIIVLFFFAQRYFIQGISLTGVKG